MAVTLYGTLTAPQWGTTDETGIIVTSLERKDSREETTLSDGDGDIQHVAYHGQNAEFTCEFKVRATGYPDNTIVGGSITLTDAVFAGTYAVREVSNVKRQGEFMGGSMVLRAFPGISFTTTTTTTTT